MIMRHDRIAPSALPALDQSKGIILSKTPLEKKQQHFWLSLLPFYILLNRFSIFFGEILRLFWNASR